MKEATNRLDTGRFPSEATSALQNLRSALGDLLSGIPGRTETPTGIQRSLGIDMTLCWKIHKVLRAPTPVAAGMHVPGMPSVKTLVNAAGKHGASSELIAATISAAEEFERVVNTHAGDRATFESMVSALGPDEEADRVDLNYRRNAFRSARHFWGMSAKTRLVCRVARPCDDPGHFDLASLQGYLSIRKLRSDARPVISHSRLTYDDDTELPTRVDPLVPEAHSEHGIAIVPEFCSKPLPTIRAVSTADGFIAGELCSEGLGRTAAMTCVIGSIHRGIPGRWYAAGVNEAFKAYALVRMPSEVLIHDIFVSDGFFAPGSPTALAFAECGDYADYPQIEERGSGAQLRISVQDGGTGPSAVHTSDVPRYTELAEYLFDRLGTDGRNYRLYRSRIEYPVMPSMTLFKFDLLQRPAE